MEMELQGDTKLAIIDASSLIQNGKHQEGMEFMCNVIDLGMHIRPRKQETTIKNAGDLSARFLIGLPRPTNITRALASKRTIGREEGLLLVTSMRLFFGSGGSQQVILASSILVLSQCFFGVVVVSAKSR
jgi:hypothetical protein